jgi:hypothetical protein
LQPILAIQSDFFAALLTGSMKESSQRNVEIREVEVSRATSAAAGLGFVQHALY